MKIKFVLFERTLEMITPPIAFPHKKKYHLHIKQIAISQERRAIWKNYTWSSFQEFFQIRQT